LLLLFKVATVNSKADNLCNKSVRVFVSFEHVTKYEIFIIYYFDRLKFLWDSFWQETNKSVEKITRYFIGNFDFFDKSKNNITSTKSV
jgi:hypothetical protein